MNTSHFVAISHRDSWLSPIGHSHTREPSRDYYVYQQDELFIVPTIIIPPKQKQETTTTGGLNS